MPDVTPTPEDVARAVANHWSSWDDPDVEVQMHVDGHYGAFRHVRKSTGEVVGWGQICYTTEHFLEQMSPEEREQFERVREAGIQTLEKDRAHKEKPHSPSP